MSTKINTPTAGNQSPYKIVMLDDGLKTSAWPNDALPEGRTSAQIHKRISGPAASPLTGDISLYGAALLVDGRNSDGDSLDVNVGTGAQNGVIAGAGTVVTVAGFDARAAWALDVDLDGSIFQPAFRVDHITHLSVLPTTHE